MSSTAGPTPEQIDALKLRQIIADIDQKRIDMLRKEQEMRYEPRKFLIQFLLALVASFSAGIAFMAYVIPHH